MSTELSLACVLVAALVAYVLGGGADFGGGVWDLLAGGRTAAAQRELIARALGPIWEANHVWLVFIVVVLFSAFPIAFSALATALHVPLSILLVGIVLRGSAFTFRSYGSGSDAGQRAWSRVFAIGSAIVPVMLGTCLGAALSGRIRVASASGEVTSDFLSSWWAPFPLAVGAFTLSLCALLAAVYLVHETAEPELRAVFRRRAAAALLAGAVLGWTCLALARSGAPLLVRGLLGRPWSPALQVLVALAGLGTLWALRARRDATSRALAIAQVVLVIAGWALSQYPYLVVPDVTLHTAAAPARVLDAVLLAVGIGALLLLPSLAYLFWIFKFHRRS